MIVDHLVTRSAVRSVGLVLAAIVPLATGYFVYMLVYKETPLDTLLAQVPVVLLLLQSNSTAASIPAHVFLNTPSPSTATAPTPVNSVAAPSTPFTLSSASASIHNNNIPHMADSGHHHSSLSPAMSSLLALAAFLESRGYRDPVNIPGYQYLIAPLAPLRHRLEPLLEPVLAFVASHKTLAWVVTLFHMWMAAE
ncbi:hypothetical protein BGZ68_003343, partial [Mortierella alpina]